jgi:diguanylate cyclase (GGDEF)-like protein/PAS domain S-box-containing protein
MNHLTTAAGLRSSSAPHTPQLASHELLEGTLDCVFLIDENWRFRYLNRRACAEIAGGKDLTGEFLWEAFPQACGTPFEENYRRVMERRVHRTFEEYFPPLKAWFEIHAAPMTDGGIGVWFRNINQRKQTERTLAAAEERSRLAARATQDLVFDWDLVADRIEWNEALAEGFGYELKDRRSSYAWWLERVHPEDKDRVDREMQAALDGGADRYQCEYRFCRADGSYAELLERGFIVRDEQLVAVRAVGAVQDNTGRNVAVRALREREADLSTLCREATVGILHRRIGGELLMVNDRFCEILGRTEEELRELSVTEFTYADDFMWNGAEHRALLAHGAPIRTEKRYIRPDGTVVWCDVTISLVEQAEGRPPSAIVIAQDISERKAAEDALRSSEERLRLVQEATEMADFESGPDGKVFCSPRFFDQLGLHRQEKPISTEDWLPLVHPEDRARLNAEIQQALSNGDTFISEFRIIRADNGDVRWISCRTRFVRNEAGELVRTLGAHRDITRRKQAETAVRESEERFRLAAEAAGLGVSDHDQATGAFEWSDRFKDILGLPPDADPEISRALGCVHPDDRQVLLHKGTAYLADDARQRFEISCKIRRASDGAERWIAASAWKRLNAKEGMRRIIVTVRDVTEEKTVQERIQWSASHDPLTGLANRAVFQQELDVAIQNGAATDEGVGLLLLDMDNFKQINDTIGHDAGDMLLKMFAERLREVAPSSGTVARFGGDEFSIVVPRLDDEESLRRLADAILMRMREPFLDKGRLLDCRVSIGASVFPQHGPSAKTLLKNADLALYAAKSAGRSRLALFEPGLAEEAKRRRDMVTVARNALADGRIVPYYQPKVHLSTGEVVGFEALLRCRDGQRRVQPPSVIGPAFEDLEVAAAISDRMIGQVIADMRGWLDRGVLFGHVAVNAAAAEFRRDNFAERLLEELHGAKIPVDHFQLEVTETVFLGRGAEYVHRALALLSASGIKIALDDFGTGYASLRHLKQFPVDLIKIDQSFVRDMEVNPGDEAIIRAVVNLGQSLGIAVIAEGVETAAQAERLIAFGCKFGQGFLFAKALPASRVPPLVRCRPRRPANHGQPGASAADLKRQLTQT